jgi:hypothetical protein
VDAREKLKKVKKYFGRENLTGKSVKKWVETRNRGLKIAEIIAHWAY